MSSNYGKFFLFVIYILKPFEKIPPTLIIRIFQTFHLNTKKPFFTLWGIYFFYNILYKVLCQWFFPITKPFSLQSKNSVIRYTKIATEVFLWIF